MFSGKETVKIFPIWHNSGEVVKEWLGSQGEFLSCTAAPHEPLGAGVFHCGSDAVKALQQWLMIQLDLAVIVSLADAGIHAYSGVPPARLLVPFLSNVLSSYFVASVTWYSLCKRWYACFPCVLAVVQAPSVAAVYGVLALLNGLVVGTAAQRATAQGTAGLILLVLYFIYGVSVLFVGVSAIRVSNHKRHGYSILDGCNVEMAA